LAANLELTIRAHDAASGVLDSITKKSSGLGSILGTAVKAGAVAATAGIAGMGALLITSVKEAAEAQKGLAQLDAVLKSTGGAAGLTREQILGMASAFQRQTTFTDDAVLSAQNLLLTFTNVKGAAFQPATQAILDMATAMGTDLQTATVQVGKALNDPIQGVTALRRVGVQLSDAQEEQIKKFVELGDVASAQGVILGELSTQFGGSAAAAADTFGGRITQLKNAFGEIQETIGMALLPILTELAKKLADFLIAHQADIETFVRGFVDFAANDALPAIRDMLVDVGTVLIEDVLPVAKELANDVLVAFKEAWDNIKGPLGFVAGRLKDFFTGIAQNETKLKIAVGLLAAFAAIFAAFQVGAMVQGLYSSAAAIVAHTAAAGGGSVATGAFTLALHALKAALITTGIGAILIGLGIAAFLLIQHWDEVRAFLEKTFMPILEKLAAVFGEVTRVIVGIVTEFASFLKNHWQEIVTVALAVLFAPAAGLFLIITHFEEIKRLVLGVVESLKNLLFEYWNEIVTVALWVLFPPGAGLFALATNAFGVRDAVVGAIREIPGLLRGLAGDFYGAASEIATQLVQGIISGVSGAGGVVGSVVDGILRAVKSLINTQIIDKINSALEFTIKGPGPVPDIHIDAPNIPHLQSGLLNVPRDMLAFLHQGEAVLPRRIAEPIRQGQFAGGGSLVFAPSIQISSLDGRLPPGEEARLTRWLEAKWTEIARRKGIGG
jgi:hypothetical protein